MSSCRRFVIYHHDCVVVIAINAVCSNFLNEKALMDTFFKSSCLIWQTTCSNPSFESWNLMTDFYIDICGMNTMESVHLQILMSHWNKKRTIEKLVVYLSYSNWKLWSTIRVLQIKHLKSQLGGFGKAKGIIISFDRHK